jgi:hypothetical protein
MRFLIFVFLLCSGCVSEVYIPAKTSNFTAGISAEYSLGYNRGYASGISDSNSDKVYLNQDVEFSKVEPPLIRLSLVYSPTYYSY